MFAVTDEVVVHVIQLTDFTDYMVRFNSPECPVKGLIFKIIMQNGQSIVCTHPEQWGCITKETSSQMRQ